MKTKKEKQLKDQRNMNNLSKEIIVAFFVIVFSNVLLELGEEQKSFMVKPISFFGKALILSIIVGLITNWIQNRAKEKKEN